MTIPVSALQEIAPGAIIELFELELNATQHGVNETYRFHAGVNADDSQSIIWASNEYLRFPIDAEGFEYSGQGQLPRPKLRVSNIFGTITAIILTLPNGLEGAKVTRIRTLARYIDGTNFPGGTNPYGTPDPTAEFPREIYYVDRKVIETRDIIEFELAAVFDLIGVRAPKRQCVSNVCQWKYRGPECGYAGNAYFNANNQPVGSLAQDACGKQLSSCELRFEQQYRTGSVTVGSNILAVSQASSFSTGDPVTGFGLPAGTTFVSAAGAQVTLSQNAFATTYVVTGGTIQSNYTQIVVSSATGITPGMGVAGAYLPANCQVVAVSGTTITLSSTVDLTQFYTTIGSFTGTPSTYFYFSLKGAVTTSNLSAPGSVGQIIASPGVLDLSRNTTITEKLINCQSVVKNVVRERVFVLSQIPVQTKTATTFSVYQFNGIPAATYTFFATNQTYTFRANANIPYGSFPGIGTYTS